MVSLLAFFLLVSSGSFYVAARFQRRYEEAVPLTIFCAVEVVFLFGLVDNLKLGFYAVCLLAAMLYALAVRQVVKEHSWKAVCKEICTPGFFIFLFLAILCALLVVGRVAVQGDEFSYWATSVKKMWYLNKLPCVPEAEPYFTEYPPGMQLLEYLVTSFYGSFSEWRMNFAYLVYLLALFLPFLRNLTHKRPLINLLAGAVVLTSGSLVYSDIYNNLMVDCALGMTFAFGMASVFLLEKRDGKWDILQVLSIVMAANMLVLIKSAGRLFAAFLLIALVLTVICRDRKSALVLLYRKKILAGLVIFPWVTAWFWKLKYLQTPASVSFDEHAYDLNEFIHILMGADRGYRSGIRDSFVAFIAFQKNDFGALTLTNLQSFMLAAALIFLAAVVWRRKERGNVCVVWVLLCGVPVYWLGLMASYMYTFSEYEGTNLASMQRYLNIYQSALVMFLVFLLLAAPILRKPHCLPAYSFLLAVLLLLPPQPLVDFIARRNVEASIATRAPFEQLAEQVRTDAALTFGDGERPCALLINRNGYPHVPVNHFTYLLWPDFRVPWECSYGTTLLFDGDYYTNIFTAEELRQHFEELGVNYIAIYCLDDDFIQQYSVLFNAPLANGQVYRVTEHAVPYELVQP